jgi:Flp pilus assembly protein CpaB
VEADAVEVQHIPTAHLPEGAISELPEHRVALAAIYAGEPVVEARLSPDGLRGVAALLPEGTRALAVPTGPTALRLAVGDTVDVLVTTDPALVEGTGATGQTVTSGALVVDVTAETVTVAVAESDAPEVAAALTQGTVTLALSAAR